jgi:hypothetical protein
LGTLHLAQWVQVQRFIVHTCSEKFFPTEKESQLSIIVEHWMSVDQMTLMQQLGALPEPA